MRRAGPILAAVALAGVLSAWVLSRPAPVSLGGDNQSLRHPLLADAFRQLRVGELPLWTHGRWGGSPLIGDADLGTLYLPYYVGYALTDHPHWRALDISTCLHLVWLAAGTAWLLGTLGVRPLAAVAATALVVTNPTLAYVARSWSEYWAALSYWPWLLGAAARLARGPTMAAALLAMAALAAQVYAGYPQFALYSGTVALAWVVACPGPGRGRRAAVAAVVGILAVGLAAPHILPGLAMARESMRLGPGGAEGMAVLDTVALAPADWMQVPRAAPMSSGIPCKLAPATLVLAVLGVTQRRFAPLFLGAVSIAAALLATKPAILYRALHSLPPFGFFGGPIKLFYLADFTLLVLAGLGLERVLAGGRWRWPALVLLVLSSIPTLATLWPGQAWMIVAGAVLLAVGGAVSPAIVLTAVSGSMLFLLSSGALALSQFELLGTFKTLLRAAPAEDGGEPGRYLALAEQRQQLRQVGMNFGALWGVEAFNGVGPLAQWRQLETLERAAADDVVPLVRQLGARRVVVLAGTPLEAALEREGAQGPPPGGGLRFLAVPNPPPRYELVPNVRAVPAPEALAAARRGMALGDGSALIEAESVSEGRVGDVHGTLEVAAMEPRGVRLHVTVDRPTWLVAREPYYRNWRATIDGQPAEIRPAGGFFLAVLVGAGRHQVILRYEEPGFWLGVLLATAVALVAAPLLRRVVAPARAPS